MESSLFLPFLINPPSCKNYAWSVFKTTKLHKEWWVVQAERWANSEDLADTCCRIVSGSWVLHVTVARTHLCVCECTVCKFASDQFEGSLHAF